MNNRYITGFSKGNGLHTCGTQKYSFSHDKIVVVNYGAVEEDFKTAYLMLKNEMALNFL